MLPYIKKILALAIKFTLVVEMVESEVNPKHEATIKHQQCMEEVNS